MSLAEASHQATAHHTAVTVHRRRAEGAQSMAGPVRIPSAREHARQLQQLRCHLAAWCDGLF